MVVHLGDLVVDFAILGGLERSQLLLGFGLRFLKFHHFRIVDFLGERIPEKRLVGRDRSFRSRNGGAKDLSILVH